MHFNWDVNVGMAISFIGSMLAVAWRLHSWDKTTAIRHAENQLRLESIGDAVRETRDEQKKCREAITDTREKVIRLEGALKSK